MRLNQGVELALKPINMHGGGYSNFLEVIKKEANNNCLAKFIVIDYDRVKKHPGELAKLKEAATSTQSFNLWLAFNNME